ncbi:MAG: hypothetical protein ACQES9_01130 [Myxococcota bacterium]
MKIKILFTFILLFTLILSCQPDPPKNPDKEKKDQDQQTTEGIDPDEEALLKKGDPPPLPEWALTPTKKKSIGRIQPKSKVVSLQLENGERINFNPPFQIHQIGNLKETDNGVVMPVRIERGKYWLRGDIDTFQIKINLSAGTNLYDKPKGVLAGFVSSPIIVQIKKVKKDWVRISHKLNEKCSPVFLKVWVKKSALLKTMKKNVKYPAVFSKKLPSRQLNLDAPLFSVYGRRRSGKNSSDDIILQLPMCNDQDQVILVKKRIRGKKGRTRVYFKPSKDAKFMVRGWMDKEMATGQEKGSCNCRTQIPESKSSGSFSATGSLDYKTRRPLPLFATPKTISKPIGMIMPSPIVKASQYYKNEKFAVIEIEPDLKLYTPWHDDYFFP